MTTNREVILQGRSLTKAYGPIVAVNDFDIALYAGEVVGLIGDNGAGKSTLVKMLAGAVEPDSGTIEHRGVSVGRLSPRDARDLGIETIYQDLAMAPNLDVVSSLFLGQELTMPGIRGWLGFLDRKRMAIESEKRLANFSITLPTVTGIPIASLSGGQRQTVAVAKAAAGARDVLFMDEPTAALGVAQSAAVLKSARGIADRGTSVVIISHVLPHVLEIADRVVVMRHGRKVADISSQRMHSVTPEQLVSLIVGLGADIALEEEDTDGAR